MGANSTLAYSRNGNFGVETGERTERKITRQQEEGKKGRGDKNQE
jgi:hypothetical protein